MKKIFFLILITAISLKGYAQDEFNTKINTIPDKDMEIKEVAPPEEAKPKVVTPPVVKKADPLEINPEELFKDRSLYKKEEDSIGIYYRRNQFLGSYKTKAFISTIRFRDAAFVDGDKIKIYVNDKVVVPEVTLDTEFSEFKINLKYGVNKIDFEALNEGFASPNTAEFEVYDDKGVKITSRDWNVGTGYKATIVLVKE